MRGEPGLGEHRLDRLGQSVLPELSAGKVDRYRNARKPGAVPGIHLRARGAQYPFADGVDKAGLFRDRNELSRRDQAVIRVLPAEQRFDACEAARLGRDQRLVMQQQLVPFDGVEQRVLHRQSAARARTHLCAIHDEAVSAARLGLVHRRIGVLEQRLRFGARVRRDADSYGDGDVERLPIDRKRLFQRTQAALGDRHRRGGILKPGKEEHELVASPPCEGIAFSNARFELGSDELEQRVAHAVSERVVDVLEAVDVDHQHGEHRALAAGLRKPAGEALVEQEPVRQRGQMIGPRQLMESLLHAFAVADVARDA